MNSKRLTEVVLAIREYAITKKFNICRNNKNMNWESQMLNLLSDEVIYNYLIALHPFQFTRGNDATQVYEFRVSYYRYNAIITVNLRQREVLSFHYDEVTEDAASTTKNTKDSYYYAREENDATAMFSDIPVIPETTSFGAGYSSYKIKRLIGYSRGNALFILTNPMLCHYDKSLPPKKGGKPSSFRGWFFLFIAVFSPRGKIAKR